MYWLYFCWILTRSFFETLFVHRCAIDCAFVFLRIRTWSNTFIHLIATKILNLCSGSYCAGSPMAPLNSFPFTSTKLTGFPGYHRNPSPVRLMNLQLVSLSVSVSVHATERNHLSPNEWARRYTATPCYNYLGENNGSYANARMKRNACVS